MTSCIFYSNDQEEGSPTNLFGAVNTGLSYPEQFFYGHTVLESLESDFFPPYYSIHKSSSNMNENFVSSIYRVNEEALMERSILSLVPLRSLTLSMQLLSAGLKYNYIKYEEEYAEEPMREELRQDEEPVSFSLNDSRNVIHLNLMNPDKAYAR